MNNIRNILILILLISESYCLTETTQISQCGNGKATYYAVEGDQNCGFGDISTKIDTAAAALDIYKGSEGCGICYEVIGERGSKIVMIADSCPGCTTVQGTGRIHLDIDQRVFPFIDDPDKGVINTSMRMVPCQVSGNVILHITETNNNYFNAYAENYRIGLKSLQININNQGYQDVPRVTWNRFIQNVSGVNSIKVKLISISGQEIVCYDKNEIIKGDYDCGAQFSADKFFDLYSRKVIKSNLKSECCVKPSLITDVSKCNTDTDYQDSDESDTADDSSSDNESDSDTSSSENDSDSDIADDSSRFIFKNIFKYILISVFLYIF